MLFWLTNGNIHSRYIFELEANKRWKVKMLKKIDEIISKIDKPYQPEIPVSVIKIAVADAFHTTVIALESRGRNKEIALSRQVAMYLIRQKTNLSLLATGKQLGDRTPATVSFGYQKIANAFESNPFLKRKVSEIEQVFKVRDC